jgi:hypothetical protein
VCVCVCVYERDRQTDWLISKAGCSDYFGRAVEAEVEQGLGDPAYESAGVLEACFTLILMACLYVRKKD